MHSNHEMSDFLLDYYLAPVTSFTQNVGRNVTVPASCRSFLHSDLSNFFLQFAFVQTIFKKFLSSDGLSVFIHFDSEEVFSHPLSFSSQVLQSENELLQLHCSLKPRVHAHHQLLHVKIKSELLSQHLQKYCPTFLLPIYLFVDLWKYSKIKILKQLSQVKVSLVSSKSTLLVYLRQRGKNKALVLGVCAFF